MGWTQYQATCYKNGQIDRRAECRKYFNGNEKWATLLKDTMVGNTWYGAVKLTTTEEVFGMVMLTSVEGNDFAYKLMDDSMGPYAYDCPESILKLLSPTENEFANNWREACRKAAKQKKELRNATVLKVTLKYDTSMHKKGDTIYLTKGVWRGQWVPAVQKDGNWITVFAGWYMRLPFIRQNEYEIIK